MVSNLFSKFQKALILVQYWQSEEDKAKADDGEVSGDELFEIAIATGIRFAEMLLPTLTEEQQDKLRQIRAVVSSKKAVYDSTREKLAQGLDTAEAAYEAFVTRID